MPFEEVETFTKDHHQPVARWLYESGARKRQGKPKLTISIPTTVCGTAKAERFVMLLGTGDDQGKVRIRGVPEKNAPPSAVKPTKHLHYFKFNFGVVPRLGEKSFDGDRVPVRKIGDDEFELTVPASWFEPDEE